MKRILIFSTNYLPAIGGAELAIKEITDRLPDVEFDLITPRFKRSLPSREQIGRVSVHRVGVGFGLDKFLIPITGVFAARRLARAHKYDAFWSMMASQASVSAALCKLLNRHTPLLLTLQEGDEEEHLKRYVFGNKFLYALLIRPWYRLVFRCADMITVISKHLEVRARRNNISAPIVVIPNGVDIGKFSHALTVRERLEFREKLGFSEEDCVMVTVSRLVVKNKVEDGIRSLGFLPPSCKLLVVGDGPLHKELDRLVSQLSLQDRVVFLGSVTPSDVPRYLSASDVFVRPSASEGFGSAFIEAMASGLPVIATSVGGIVDFLEDKKTGLFCTVGDPKDIARKVTILMRDRARREEIIMQARAMVSLRYDWEAIAREMEERAFTPLMHLTGTRVLLATGIFPPSIGGPAQYALNLSEALGKLGSACSVVTYGKRELPTGLRHVAYFFRLLLPLWLSDSVIALDTFSSGVPAVFAARLLRRKVVVRVGGDFLWEQYVERTKTFLPLPDFYRARLNLTRKEKMIFLLTRWVLRAVHAVVYSTHWQQNIWQTPYKLTNRRLFVVENYYGVKVDSIVPIKKNFIWAGRPIVLKNVERLKKAFALAKARDTSISLELRSEPHEVLLENIRGAYAVLVPSLSEVSPNLILEAIRFDKPFLLTKYNGLTDRIDGCGVFIDPLEEHDIMSGILSLAEPSEYGQFQRKLRARTFVHEWRDIAEEFISIFKRI